MSTKREQLLDTAERLFYAEGFHATGIDRLVRAAGTTRMTLYSHFPSKEALIAEVLQRRNQRFLTWLDEAVTASAPGGTTTALVAAHNQWVAEQGQLGCIMVKAIGEYAAHSAPIHEAALQAKRALHERLRAALTRDGLDGDSGLAERVYLVLEGTNSAIPVIGLEPVLDGAAAAIDALLNHHNRSAPA
ncbi:MAG: TetR/AcrR family transcriptional regulator [Arhodomonas sp.]|nr:TetR/AcrR family transcriptional regulator [Arhodomonas sp.]